MVDWGGGKAGCPRSGGPLQSDFAGLIRHTEMSEL